MDHSVQLKLFGSLQYLILSDEVLVQAILLQELVILISLEACVVFKVDLHWNELDSLMFRLSCTFNSKGIEERSDHFKLDNIHPSLIIDSFVLHQVQRYCLLVEVTLDFFLVFEPISLWMSCSSSRSFSLRSF